MARSAISGWLRLAVRGSPRTASDRDTERRLTTIRQAYMRSYPTADLDHVLAEIEQGYRSL